MPVAHRMNSNIMAGNVIKRILQKHLTVNLLYDLME